jgi:hypothetical protein
MTLKRLVTAALLAVLSLGALLPLAPSALAEETACTGAIAGRTLDNVRVPSGRACTLTGTRVIGTVLVERGATLVARRVNVNGNISAEGATRVSVETGSVVGGSIQLGQGRGFTVVGTRVVGVIQVTSNVGASTIRGNTVNGDIQVFSHAGGISISSNRVGGNLQCKENSPAPTGGGNVVQGNKEDQCRRL